MNCWSKLVNDTFGDTLFIEWQTNIKWQTHFTNIALTTISVDLFVSIVKRS